jgi:20S proteasome alpha/beta subunit
VDPSGAWWEADAGAIGAGEREANALLEKKYRRTGAKEAEALAAEALGRPGRLQIARLPES